LKIYWNKSDPACGGYRSQVVFKNAAAEALPFPDAHFDVLSTLMLHHLPVKPLSSNTLDCSARFTQCSAADFVIDAGEGLTVATSPLVGTLNRILISNFRPTKVPPQCADTAMLCSVS
jgi:hypothetical protein